MPRKSPIWPSMTVCDTCKPCPGGEPGAKPRTVKLRVKLRVKLKGVKLRVKLIRVKLRDKLRVKPGAKLHTCAQHARTRSGAGDVARQAAVAHAVAYILPPSES